MAMILFLLPCTTIGNNHYVDADTNPMQHDASEVTTKQLWMPHSKSSSLCLSEEPSTICSASPDKFCVPDASIDLSEYERLPSSSSSFSCNDGLYLAKRRRRKRSQKLDESSMSADDALEYGIFAARSYQVGETFENYTSNGFLFYDHDRLFPDWFQRHYLRDTWSTVVGDAIVTVGPPSSSRTSNSRHPRIFFPSPIGAMARFHPILANVVEGSVKCSLSSPSSSSTIALCTNMTWVVTRPIQRGDEIFLGALHNLGEGTQHQHQQEHPSRSDYCRALTILECLWDFYQEVHSFSLDSASWIGLSNLQWKELLQDRILSEWQDLLRLQSDDDHHHHQTSMSLLLPSLLPHTLQELQWLAERVYVHWQEKNSEETKGHHQSGKCNRKARMALAKAWLEYDNEAGSRAEELLDNMDQNCLDGHVAVQPNGQMETRRSFAKGETISPVPLVPLPYTMSRRKENPYAEFYQNCLGHFESNGIVLCPLSLLLPRLNEENEEPNARLEWVRKDDSTNLDQLLLQSPQDVFHWFSQSQMPACFMMQLVATRDINLGEELIIAVEHNEFMNKTTNTQHNEKDVTITTSGADQPIPQQDPFKITHECRLHPYIRERGVSTRLLDYDIPSNYQNHTPTNDKSADADAKQVIAELMEVDDGLPPVSTLRDNSAVGWFPCSPRREGRRTNDTYFKVYSKRMKEPRRRLIRQYRNVPPHAIRPIPLDHHAQEQEDHTSHNNAPYQQIRLPFIPLSDDLFPPAWRLSVGMAPIEKDNHGQTKSTSTKSTVIKRTRSSTQHVDSDNIDLDQVLRDHETMLRQVPCGVYFGPSSIPNAGNSMYAAVPFQNANIPISGSDVSAIVVPKVPFSRSQNGRRHQHSSVGSDLGGGTRNMLDDYVWLASKHGAEFEVDGSRHKSVVLGTSLANSHPALVNTIETGAVFRPLLDRCRGDPGAGAFSDYDGAGLTSRQLLKAGEELFVSYGEEWFKKRDEFNNVPLGWHYKVADNVMKSIDSFRQSLSEELKNVLVKPLLQFARSLASTKRMSEALAFGTDSVESFQRVLNRNGAAQATIALRSPQWFKENATCMDHVIIRESTIRQVGRGAFVRRAIEEGGVIISSPLLLTWGHQSMRLRGHKSFPPDINEWQLHLNYHFGHPHSTLHLLPINQMLMVNHASLRGQHFDNAGHVVRPNAEIRWGVWDAGTRELLRQPLQALMKQNYSCLIMDVIARRDIAVGEEVFIDYGVEWDKAWEAHVQSYQPLCDGPEPSYSSMDIWKMNHNKFVAPKWSDDHMTVCTFDLGMHAELVLETVLLIPESHSMPTVEQFDGVLRAREYHNVTVSDDYFQYRTATTSRHPCRICQGDVDTKTFEVLLFPNQRTTMQLVENSGFGSAVVVHLKALPASQVEYIPRPWKSDMFRQNAFRHLIGIPDSIFPEQWKDKMK